LGESLSSGLLASTVRPVGKYKGRSLVASVASTKLILTPAPGIYRAVIYAVASASTAGTLIVALSWTDSQAAQSNNVVATGVLVAGQFTTGNLILQVASGSVAFTTTVGGVLTYDLDVVLERLS
jgi:hypothetical protein